MVPFPDEPSPPGFCPESASAVAAAIDKLLHCAATAPSVAAFYDPNLAFAGDMFLDVGQNNPYTVGAADLLAVGFMDVSVSVTAARVLLRGGRLASQVRQLLTRIPVGVPIWSSTERDLAWATSLWSLLTKHVPGIGPTKAGKILARKRPELIPIIDGVLSKQLNCRPNTYWTAFRDVLQDQALRNEIASLRPGAPVLRIADTMMWIHWSTSRTARSIVDPLCTCPRNA